MDYHQTGTHQRSLAWPVRLSFLPCVHKQQGCGTSMRSAHNVEHAVSFNIACLLRSLDTPAYQVSVVPYQVPSLSGHRTEPDGPEGALRNAALCFVARSALWGGRTIDAPGPRTRFNPTIPNSGHSEPANPPYSGKHSQNAPRAKPPDTVTDASPDRAEWLAWPAPNSVAHGAAGE
jgi:hypothetical protein